MSTKLILFFCKERNITEVVVKIMFAPNMFRMALFL